MVLFSINATSLALLLLLPVAVLQVLLLILLPSLHAPGARAAGVLKATYSYALQGIGIALMSAGAIPALHSVCQKFITGFEPVGPQVYIAFLMMFLVGGATFLWHEQMSEKIDDASRRVPALLFWYTVKTIGFLIILMSGATLIVTMLLKPDNAAQHWWITPLILFFYGILLSWCTKSPKTPSDFKSIQLHGPQRGKKRR
jgi:cbb3-type cytochrome oxidase subunit 3